MGKELMVSVEAVSGCPAGTRLYSDDVLVQQNPRNWVPFAAGDRAIWKRRSEFLADQERVQAEIREKVRAEAIKVGARSLPTDDAIVTAVKELVRRNSDFELVRDDLDGRVIGARPKHRAPVPVVTSGYLGDDK